MKDFFKKLLRDEYILRYFMPFISVPKYLGLMKNDGEYCTVSKPGMFYINFYSSQQAIEVCKRR